MKPTYRCNLIIDSACDLPASIINRPGVEVLKFPYTLSDGEHSDCMFTDQTPREFYDAIRHGEAPKTAQLPMPDLMVAFTNAAISKVPTVFLCFSSGLSGTYDSACMARAEVCRTYPEADIRIIDSRLASIAEGILVAEAIRQRERGMSAEELEAWAREAVYYVNCLFMVEDLETLGRGGRLPSVGAYLGSKLDVKPLCNFDLDGRLTMTGLARGRKKGIRALAEAFEKGAVEESTPSRVFLGHADCEKDCAKLKDAILRVQPDALIIECNIGPTIGCHVGPGMLAVAYWGHDRRESISFTDKLARSIKNK